MKTLYAGIDLHGNNSYLAVVGVMAGGYSIRGFQMTWGGFERRFMRLRKSWWGLSWNRRIIGIG